MRYKGWRTLQSDRLNRCLESHNLTGNTVLLHYKLYMEVYVASLRPIRCETWMFNAMAETT